MEVEWTEWADTNDDDDDDNDLEKNIRSELSKETHPCVSCLYMEIMKTMKTFWWFNSAETVTDINLIIILFKLKFFYRCHCSLNKVLCSQFCGLGSLATFYAGPPDLSAPATGPSFNSSKCLSPFCSQALCICWPVPWLLPNPPNPFA